MTNTELLAAVRQIKESGELQRIAGSGVAGVLAQFALAVLEQPEVAWRHLDGALEFAKPLTQSKSVADSWKAKGWNVAPMFMLPPVPLASTKGMMLGYVDMFAVMRMHDGRSRFASLRPEPKSISYVRVYAGESVAVPKSTSEKDES
ncbi:hypothetical protein [Sodalis ligni]|uniref:Uncharacterized protein n=1 Tax=Sodalis ligni TaxID=2697027 RepID=A0A4R1NQ27_9GAMM|nr:hypothetical protein [Sodalis ligni]TCL06846.1 hypothetical protein EZJ58_5143 [Sodalis ligni]